MFQNIATKVLTGEVRLSYVHLIEPYANPNNTEAKPKYQATLLIPKTDTATKQDIDNSMRAAYESAVTNDWKGARPQLKNALIYDGDGFRTDGTKFGPECAGHWVITASSKNKPQVVSMANIAQQLDDSEIYSGMYGRVTINFYSFNVNGNKGVGCGLGNVLKTRDGEPLAGGASATSDFAGFGQMPTSANDFANATRNEWVPVPEGDAGLPWADQTAKPAGNINPITGLPM